jgi:hypothetical protein
MGAATRTPALRVACLTMVRDDVTFLDIWVRYYSALFGAVNCFVVDHGSTEMAALDRARALGVQVLRVAFDYPAFAPAGIRPDGQPVQFDGFRFNFLSKLRAALRVFYDVILLHDADEVLIVHPDRQQDLPAYLARQATTGIVGALGVELFHVPCEEASFDPARPVLEQRRHAHFRLPQSKPVLFGNDQTSMPHGAAAPFGIDPDLWLIHLKFLDRDLMFQRQIHRHDAVQRGEVPDWTRWGWAASEVDARLAELIDRPLDPDDSRGRSFLASHFRADDAGRYVVDRAKQRSPRLYEPDAGIPLAVQAALHDARFILAPSFRSVAL